MFYLIRKLSFHASIFFISISLAQDPPEQFQYNQSTLQAFYYIGIAEAAGEDLTENDWIAAFRDNICVGSAPWQGEFTTLPVMGDSGHTWTDGYMQNGEYPEYQIYDQSENQFTVAIPSNNFAWSNNAFYTIDMLDMNNTPEIPETFEVSLYPNPFNPETTISIQLETAGKIQLQIFDLNGRQIDNIYSGYAYVGSHEFKWRANNYPAGVYFLCIFIDYISFTKSRKIHTQKLVILK